MAEYIGLADRDRRRGSIYPSPFFDIAQTYMPPTVKELFRWCRYFFYKDPMIGSVVTKIAEYPVTDFVYGSTSKPVRDLWRGIIEDTLNLKPFLIEIGLDYFTYGNAFVSINLPFVRWIKCGSCETPYKLSDSSFVYKLVNFEFHFACKKCSAQTVGKVDDRPVKDRSGINFVRWAPHNIDIHYNPITGKSKYRYKIPAKVRKAIMDGTRDILVDIPLVFLQALKAKRDVALSEQNIFHFKRPTLAEEDMGWGKPLIMHSMSRMFYLYVLRRAQEAIALQRIMPLEFIFPQANSSQDPYQHVNLSGWTSTVQQEISKWRQDPNYISVVAVPLGFERLGGDGRALLIGPEIEVTNREITGGMGVPVEFVFGGLSWSGSSVSLRTLENHFLLYRRLLLQFVNWSKTRIRLYLNLPDIDIRFTEFKMADDVQRKQLVIQLNAANKISDHTMLTELGFDYDEEQKTIERETESRNKISVLQMKSQTESQGEAQLIQAKYQARAQRAFQESQGQQPGVQPQENQAQTGQGADQQAPDQQGAAPQAVGDDKMVAQQEALQQAANVKSNVAGESGTSSGGNIVPLNASSIAQKWANRISKMDLVQRKHVLAELAIKMPNMQRLVAQLVAQTVPGQTVGQTEERMRPLPQAKPPQRDGGVI